jgi:hypothetical protein
MLNNRILYFYQCKEEYFGGELFSNILKSVTILFLIDEEN